MKIMLTKQALSGSDFKSNFMDYIPVDQYIHAPVHTTSTLTVKSAILTCGRLKGIVADLEDAQSYITQKNYKKALALLDNGILEIGIQYFSPETDDDTGMKLMLANRVDNVAQAAHLKRAVLASRVAMFNTLHQCDKLPDEVKLVDYIGEVWMENSGEIILQLFSQDDKGTSGHAMFRYSKDHPQYNEILTHVNGLKPGERKGVLPWP